MNRFWLIIAVAGALVINPVFGQNAGKDKKDAAGKDAAKTDTAKPADKPADKPVEKPADKPAENAGSGAVVWKDKQGANFANSKVKFVLSPKDNMSGVDYIEYRVDDGQFQKYQGALSILDEGPHTIIYRAVDKAGNREVDQAYTVTLDNSAPVISVLPAKQFVQRQDGKYYTATGNSFTIRVIDNFAGIKAVKYAVNANELKDYANDTITLSTPGTQVIKYYTEDNLGNRVDGTIMVEVDADKPVVEIMPNSPLIPVETNNYARRNTAFKIRGTDTGSGVERILVRIDDSKDWVTYTDALFFDKEGPHSIETKALDAVGNESESKTEKFDVDDNPPTTELKPSLE